MKKLVTVLALVFTMSFIGATLSACGRDYVDDENTVIINFFEGGYGKEFIKQMGKEFEAKNPGKRIVVEDTTVRNKLIDILKSGPIASESDITMTNGSAYELLGKGKDLGFGNDYILEPLTDVFDSKDESGKTLRERYFKSYYPSTVFKDKEYMMTWSSGIQGLIYHEDMFEGKQVPRTTDELLQTAKEFKSKGLTPFVYSGQVDYWNALHLTWWAQYEGSEEYFKFYKGKATVEFPVGSGKFVDKLSPKIFEQAGREQSLEVLEQLLTPVNDLCDKESTGLTFSDAQNKFLQKKAVMHPNGDWLEGEALGNYDPSKVKIRFMKTPVISSLGTKLGITESELATTIDYIDGGGVSSKPTYANSSLDVDKTIAAVAEARQMIYLSGTTHFAAIPSYSNAIPLAKEFLKFMYSNRGLEIFAETTHGATLPVEYDYEANTELYAKFSDFQKSRVAIMDDKAVGIYQEGRDPISYRGMLKAYSYNAGVLESAFGATNVKDRKTPKEVLAADILKYDAAGWQNLLRLSGYID